jgi:hypothetical protein
MTDRGLPGRRALLRGFGAIGTSALLGGRPRFADAEPPPETTKLRLLTPRYDYALRLREACMIKSTPQRLIAQGTDWRFFNELKTELKG